MIEKIKNKQDYDNAMVRVEELIDIDPEKGTDLANELEHLCKIINKSLG